MRSVMSLFVLAAVAAYAGGAEPQKPPVLIEACVGIWGQQHIQSVGTRHGSGTAVPGAPKGCTFILTASHVVEDGGESVYWNKELYHYTIVAVDATHDLAVIAVQAELPTVPIGTAARAADTVTMRGFSGHKLTTRVGTLVRATGDEAKVAAASGDSGAGLISKDGKLIGVVTSGVAPGTGVITVTGAGYTPAAKLLETAAATKFTLPTKIDPKRYKHPDHVRLTMIGSEGGWVEGEPLSQVLGVTLMGLTCPKSNDSKGYNINATKDLIYVNGVKYDYTKRYLYPNEKNRKNPLELADWAAICGYYKVNPRDDGGWNLDTLQGQEELDLKQHWLQFVAPKDKIAVEARWNETGHSGNTRFAGSKKRLTTIEECRDLWNQWDAGKITGTLAPNGVWTVVPKK